ncbi:MAG TPA: DUF4240 domain-containing protein [Tepidisphaeraceae bacterium]|nr:DUF4240 domain-containing protein [Tepidisphaeraceae bacterium]
MDDAEFWNIIARGRRKTKGNMDRLEAAVRKDLRSFPPEKLIAFEQAFNRQLGHAYMWDLWAAAFLMQGGCSDDGFFYFRGWLVAQGHSAYLAAITNPDTLADFANPEDDEEDEKRDEGGEQFLYVAREVFQEKSGGEMPTQKMKHKLIGKRWKFENDVEMSKRLPRLSGIYNRPEDDDGDGDSATD